MQSQNIKRIFCLVILCTFALISSAQERVSFLLKITKNKVDGSPLARVSINGLNFESHYRKDGIYEIKALLYNGHRELRVRYSIAGYKNVFPGDTILLVPNNNNGRYYIDRPIIMCLDQEVDKWAGQRVKDAIVQNFVSNSAKQIGNNIDIRAKNLLLASARPELIAVLSEMLISAKGEAADNSVNDGLKKLIQNDPQGLRLLLDKQKLLAQLTAAKKIPVVPKDELELLANKFNLLGDSYLIEGSFDQAIQLYQKSQEAVDNLNIRLKIILVNIVAGNLSDALLTVGHITEITPQNKNDQFKILAIQFSFDVAKETVDESFIKRFLTKVRELDIDNSQSEAFINYSLAIAYFKLGKNEAAMKYINKALIFNQLEMQFSILNGLKLMSLTEIIDIDESYVLNRLDTILTKLINAHPRENIWRAYHTFNKLEISIHNFKENGDYQQFYVDFDNSTRFVLQHGTFNIDLLYAQILAQIDAYEIAERSSYQKCISVIKNAIVKLQGANTNGVHDLVLFYMYKSLATAYYQLDGNIADQQLANANIGMVKHLFDYTKVNEAAIIMFAQLDSDLSPSDKPNKDKLGSTYIRLLSKVALLPESQRKMMFLNALIFTYLNAELLSDKDHAIKMKEVLPIFRKYLISNPSKSVFDDALKEKVNAFVFDYYFDNNDFKSARNLAEDEFLVLEKNVNHFLGTENNLYTSIAGYYLPKSKLYTETFQQVKISVDSIINTLTFKSKRDSINDQIAINIANNAFPLLLEVGLKTDSTLDKTLTGRFIELCKSPKQKEELYNFYAKVVNIKSSSFEEKIKETNNCDYYDQYVNFLTNPQISEIKSGLPTSIIKLPDSVTVSNVFNRYATCVVQKHDYKKAATLFRSTIDWTPVQKDKNTMWYSFANTSLLAGNMTEALEGYRKIKSSKIWNGKEYKPAQQLIREFLNKLPSNTYNINAKKVVEELLDKQ